MQIEDAYIKYIKINNKAIKNKEFYLVIEVNQKKWVGRVERIEKGRTLDFQQFEKENIKIQQKDEVYVSLWDYNYAKEVERIGLSTEKIVQSNFSKIVLSTLQLQIHCQSKPSDSTKTQSKTKHQRISLQKVNMPDIFLHRNSIQHKDCSSNAFPRPSLPLMRPSLNSFTYGEEETANQTSLEKIIDFDHKSSQKKVRRKESQKQLQFIEIIENRISLKANTSTNFYDDYQAKPKQWSKKQLKEGQKMSNIQSQQNLSKQVNSTTSSSVVKKHLKNAIKILTQNPLKIQNSQKTSPKFELNGNRSRHFFDYGLTESKRMSRTSNLHKDSTQMSDSKNFQKFYEKSLTKNEIEKVAMMNSFELSKSIYQQYGLDLSLNKSLNKANMSKSLQKSKEITKERKLTKEDRKIKVFAQSQKISKKVRNQTKNQKKIDDNKFQDYGEQSVSIKKGPRSRSLRKTQRPKGHK